MKAIQIEEFGGPEVLEVLDLPEPHAGEGQVRIRVTAVDVNPSDTLSRTRQADALMRTADPDLEHSVRELAAAAVVHIISPKDGNVEAPTRHAEDVILFRLALRRIAAERGEGAPAFRDRFGESYGRLDEGMATFEKAVGPEIIGWLDSKWAQLRKAVYARKKISMFVDDEEGYGQVLGDGTVAPDQERHAQLAVVNCPEHAIEVT